MSPELESEVSPAPGSAAGRPGGRRWSAGSASVPAHGERVIPVPVRVLAGVAAVRPPPPPAGTLVLRRSCWPSPPAVGGDPAVRATPGSAPRPRAASGTYPGPEAPARPAGPRAAGRTRSEDLADLGLGGVAFAGAGGASWAAARPCIRPAGGTRAPSAQLSAGHRRANFLPGPGPPGSRPFWEPSGSAGRDGAWGRAHCHRRGDRGRAEVRRPASAGRARASGHAGGGAYSGSLEPGAGGAWRRPCRGPVGYFLSVPSGPGGNRGGCGLD